MHIYKRRPAEQLTTPRGSLHEFATRNLGATDKLAGVERSNIAHSQKAVRKPQE